MVNARSQVWHTCFLGFCARGSLVRLAESEGGESAEVVLDGMLESGRGVDGERGERRALYIHAGIGMRREAGEAKAAALIICTAPSSNIA